jgi:FkbM family methyltransferase
MPLGLYEPETAAFLCDQFRKDMTFLDIGSNAGYFTLLGSKCVGEVGITISFEPITLNCTIIESHLQANKINNVKVERLAISDTTGEVKFNVEKNNENSHISNVIITHAESDLREVLIVKTLTLDEYIETHKIKPDVIKIDDEGSEVAVLRGALECLRVYKPTCIISLHSKECPDGCIEILDGLGYSFDRLAGFEHELCCYPISK